MTFQRGRYNNNQQGSSGADMSNQRKPATTLIVYSDLSDDDVAFINSYDTQYGRKSIISICRKSGEIEGNPKFTELKRIKDVEPMLAIGSAKKLLQQLGNGGGQDGDL